MTSDTPPMPAVFTYREGLEAGLTPGLLRGPTFAAPFLGVRTLHPVDSFPDHLHALGVALDRPWAASHETAARLHGLPLPPTPAGERLHVMTPAGTPAVRRTGVVGHRGLERRRTLTVADTALDLCARLPEEWAVAVCDAVLAKDGDPGQLLRVREERRGDRGHRRFDAACRAMRPGVRSPMESVSRVLAVRAGFPEPEVNVPMFDQQGGWLGEGDLVWRDLRIVAEYQGGVHRVDPRQWRRDLSRQNSLAAAGWLVVQLTGDHVARPARLEAALRAAFVARGWRDG